MGYFLELFLHECYRASRLSSDKYNKGLGKSSMSFDDIDYLVSNGSKLNCQILLNLVLVLPYCSVLTIKFHYVQWFHGITPFKHSIMSFAHLIKRYFIASSWIRIKFSKTNFQGQNLQGPKLQHCKFKSYFVW